MDRASLLGLLDDYYPTDPLESNFKEETLNFIKKHENCFERSLSVGHITGAALITYYSGSKALLTHHAKLDRWLQLGGHADGNPNIVEVSTSEAQEESGLSSIQLVSKQIFDLDVHLIPSNHKETAHLHYDIRFLFQADEHEKLHVSSESKNLKWLLYNALADYTQHNTSIIRMAEKCLKR